MSKRNGNVGEAILKRLFLISPVLGACPLTTEDVVVAGLLPITALLMIFGLGGNGGGVFGLICSAARAKP